MKPIIRGLTAAALCVAIGSPITATDLWSVSNSGTCHTATKSINGGASWIPATGVAPYDLPCTESYGVVMRGGSDTFGRPIVLVGSTQHLWRSVDDGNSWREVSGPGSGLEGSSKVFSALITTVTSYGHTDILVGVTGSTTGGVYLSGDGGLHWMQINSGFDPNSLNISTLVTTSCSGCPVQYYSGTYGSGVYTRTIAVLAPPSVTGWCFGSTTCTCGTQAASGSTGQAFKLCGANFTALPTVTFGWLGLNPRDGAFASGCSTANANTITCTGAAACGSGGVPSLPYGSTVYINVRNTDSRDGLMPVQFNN